MSFDINRVIVVGRVASDIELKHTANGKAVANFRIAVGGMPKADGSDSVSFFNVVAWNKTAENCRQFLEKGKQIGIDGRLDQRSWQAQDGSKRSTVEIIADRIEFLGSKPNAAAPGSTQAETQSDDNSQFYDSNDPQF